MKKIAFLMMTAVVLVLAGCGKDDKDNNTPAGGEEIPTTFDIEGTSWVGYYNDYITHPQAGQVPVHLKWTLDFNEGGQAEFYLEADADGQQQSPQTMAVTYTYEGLSGVIIYDEGGTHAEDPFTVDPVNLTFELELIVPMGFSAEEPQYAGGVTTFHQIH